ncbi:MAG TPA: carbohydrate-binding domain-containing protein [Sphingobium sp.]|uniref:carbohydrate-binding domain-containing protein n=1 Tax=Sphingobium sp. TaxID=1912891 RepID=UPI002ED3AC89
MATSAPSLVKAPLSQTLGAGSDKFVLHLSQQYYAGDAQVTISVDGKQVGGIVTLSSLYGSGSSDTLTVLGDWGGGAHQISVNFINDLRDKVTGEDRNVAVLDISYNGTAVLSSTAMLWSNGPQTFNYTGGSRLVGTNGADTITGTKYADIITGGYGNDTLTGGGGADCFVMKRGDGKDVITDFTVSGPQANIIQLSGYMFSTFDELKSRMTQSGKDTVLQLDVNNVITLNNVDKNTLTAANFQITDPLAKLKGANLAAGTGSDTLVLKLTQDYLTGDNAKYTVLVDGKQVGGVFSTSAVRYTGEQDILTLSGNWGAGQHSVTVNFLNDAGNPLTQEDRNLNILSATMNGVAVTNAAKAMYVSGAYSFTTTIAAAKPPVVEQPATSTPVASHDTFTYTKGAASLVITGFGTQGADSDVLRIDGYGLLNRASTGGTTYTTFDSLKSVMSQVGTDTVIKLSATDVITLKNVTMSTLTEDNFALISHLVGPAQYSTNNGWVVTNNTWNSGDLTYGKDYTISASYDAAAMTTGTTFSWSYPVQPSYGYTKVLAYPSIEFGVDTYKDAAGTSYDPAHVLAAQLSHMSEMKANFSVTNSGDTAGFDTSFDLWLTKAPNGIWSDVTNEVMIWVHQGGMQTWGDKVGTYTDGNYTATIYHTGTYTALVPDKDYDAGTIDVKDILNKLTSMGIISSSEYLNQIDFGSEPWKGAGSLTVNSLSYDVQTVDAAGIITKSHADGGVTTQTKQGTAGADVIETGTAKVVTLIGGAGNDTFLFKKGDVGAVTVQDFHAAASGSTEHDLLKFSGYGAGATLVHDSGDAWSVHYTGGVDHITLTGVQSLSASDYAFI